MTKNNQKIREQVIEAEQAADIAVAAVRAEERVGQQLTTAVSTLHDWARQAKQSLDGSMDDVASLRGFIGAAEEAADQALIEAKDDQGIAKATQAAIQEAHDAIKKAKDLF